MSSGSAHILTFKFCSLTSLMEVLLDPNIDAFILSGRRVIQFIFVLFHFHTSVSLLVDISNCVHFNTSFDKSVVLMTYADLS